MSLDARIRHAGFVTIVELSGRIVLGEECVWLGKLVSDLLERGDNKILLDLADVHRIDTAGLARIFSGMVSVRKRDGDLKLLHPRKDFQNVLEITRMLSVLDTSHDEGAAIKSFVESARGRSAVSFHGA